MTSQNHYMQTPAWAAAKGRTGFEVREVQLDTKMYGKVTLFLYVKRVKGLGKLAYGPMWPDVFSKDAAITATALKQVAGDCFLVRIEPAIDRESVGDTGAKAAGFVSTHGKHIQYLSTLVVDLDKSEEEVLASLHKTARYDIKQAAQKFGVICEQLPINTDTIKQLTDINLDTKSRKQFYMRGQDFLQDYWNEFGKAGQGNLYASRLNNEIIAMSYVVINGDKAFYKDAGSVSNSTGAASALQWFVIQDLIKRRVKSYDLCGALANGIETEADPLWGVYKFKNKFTKNLVTYPGFIDLPIKKVKYALWRKNERIITKATRKLTGEIFY